MNVTSISSRTLIILRSLLIPFLIIIGFYLISLQNYLLFHGIVELAGIAVAFCIFIIVWNSRKVISNPFFLIIGISFLFIASIDMIHTFAYKGMGIIPGAGADLPTQLWIAARAFQSIAFLIATLFIGRSLTKGRRYDAEIIISGCTLVCSLLYASIFLWHVFPPCFIDGIGLTHFKIFSEYLISSIFIVAVGILYIRRKAFDPEVWQYLAAALIFLIAGELAFTSYVSVYGFMNLLGHLFRFVSAYLFYKAIVVVSLTQPYTLLFRELKENERSLTESESRYRSLFDHMEEGNLLHELVFDEEGRATDYRIIAANPGSERILGLHKEDIIGKLSRDAFRVKEPPFLERYAQVEKTGESYAFETYFPDWDKYYSISAYSPQRGQFATVFTDITERKRTEKAIHELITDYQTILENIPVMIWYKDTRNNYIRVNSAAAKVLGCPISEIEGKSTDDLFPDLAESYYHDDLEVITTGNAKLGIIEQMSTANGERIWIQKDKLPLRDEDGNITGVLVVSIDITERKKAEDAFILANKKLNLLSSITRHDIGNELQIIFGYGELTQDEEGNPQIRKYLDKIEESAQHIERMIAFTRDYQDIGVHSPVWLDIRTVLTLVLHALDISPIQVQVDISGIEVYADPLMEKVFFNLIDNAKRYGETITSIRFFGAEGEGGYTIICEDNGVGIPVEFKSKIFNREYYKHTGFGLNLSREILDITGITIRETGEPGKGARFEILVPEGKYRYQLNEVGRHVHEE